MTTRQVASLSLVCCFTWLVGCSTPTRPLPMGMAPTESGPDVAQHLQKRFDENMADCGSPTRPAFLCSGILMRSTEYSPNYHSWDPNPTTAAWGISFSWLRSDSNFRENYPSGNGFIVYPFFYADDKPYDKLSVNCVYPHDAWTAQPDRCRTHRQVCQDLTPAVTTAVQWLARFDDNANQCAFGVEDGRAQGTADAWMQAVAVRKAQPAIFDRNEVIVADWGQNTRARMPLEAFFYRTNQANALTPAQNDQRDFRTTAGRWVPVIRWTPATTANGRATFEYHVADQAILQ